MARRGEQAVRMTAYAEPFTRPLPREQRPGVTVTRDGLLRIATSLSPLLLRLEGEADLSNRELLAAALRTMTAPGPSDLHVDLGGLAFIDVGGVVLLHRAEQVLIRQGRRLRMHGVPPVARKTMCLLGWEASAVEGAAA
jgi:anti-anti-sigma regulatory factor